MSEAAIQKAILTAVNCIPGCVFWRNNSGQARIRGSHVRFGLCPGAGDIIGIITGGRFASLEVKDGAPVSKEQLAFVDLVRAKGGVAAVVRSVPEAVDVVLAWCADGRAVASGKAVA